MNNEHQILSQIKKAKEHMYAADEMIKDYMPFIRGETVKFLKRPIVDENDDEPSIAMIAFYEAIQNYSQLRGAFLNYAALHIRSRLIDYARKEQRHKGWISLDHSDSDEDETPMINKLADTENHAEELALREATRTEIAEFSSAILEFGINLTDVSEHCPRQKRTLESCRKGLEFAKRTPEIMEDFLRTKRLPIAKIVEGTGVERKVLERHRKYMVALLLAYTNGFEIIRGHLKCVMKGENDQ